MSYAAGDKPCPYVSFVRCGLTASHIATYQVVTNIPVGDTHSVAANSENNHIFVPVTAVGVTVYSEGGDQEGKNGK
jgi:hypothetical protein